MAVAEFEMSFTIVSQPSIRLLGTIQRQGGRFILQVAGS